MREYNFTLNRAAILGNPRLMFLEEDIVPISKHLDNIEHFINVCFAWEGHTVVQKGQVIALRTTDEARLSSAFKASIYLGKYGDMANTGRFLTSMVAAGHSYEPIRGENVLFLYIGVDKPVYDHMVTYTVGRPTRIAGGQRANVPWGFSIPVEAKDRSLYEDALNLVRRVARLAKQEHVEQMQAIRNTLPVGYITPPFLMEFSEEALIKTVFRQRLFEKGAQGATVEIVKNMLDCLLEIDPIKWNTLIEYHGPHLQQWEKVMRSIRNERPKLVDIVPTTRIEYHGSMTDVAYAVKRMRELLDVDLYDLLIEKYGKMSKSMWERMK